MKYRLVYDPQTDSTSPYLIQYRSGSPTDPYVPVVWYMYGSRFPDLQSAMSSLKGLVCGGVIIAETANE
jgi:hypothetical protein